MGQAEHHEGQNKADAHGRRRIEIAFAASQSSEEYDQRGKEQQNQGDDSENAADQQLVKVLVMLTRVAQGVAVILCFLVRKAWSQVASRIHLINWTPQVVFVGISFDWVILDKLPRDGHEGQPARTARCGIPGKPGLRFRVDRG